MPDSQTTENDFLNKITDIILENISNDKFGVSELANEIGMSRSNLLRKVNKLAKISVSQFMNQVRLKSAMEMLKQTSFNVSEVSFKVGFSSTSYFIKCFHDFYGYSPGEVGKRDLSENEITEKAEPNKRRRIAIISSAFFLMIIIASIFYVLKPFKSHQNNLEKSIAVLPFKNDSNDSTNVYIVNGLMESILTKLQKIEDLKVISRTSVEKYRNTTKSIPEIAKELNVSYFVEGSGQKIGDKILLHVQLIEAKTDKHLWAEQYNKVSKDIFKLQIDVAKNIAEKIEAVITPEEKERISIIPTDNVVAYDYFLKALDLMNHGNLESLEKAINNFKKAIELDAEFARAYSGIAMCYYYLDIYQTERKHIIDINNYADKALLLDSNLPQGLLAKAMYYMINGKNELAATYLEKALYYDPNSSLVLNFLANFYSNHSPNTEKYLEYALKGISIDIAALDSVSASFTYLHLSNAFIQLGFVNEAEKYINMSLEYDPNNIYSAYVKVYILHSRNKDLAQTKDLLIEILDRDTTRLDVVQEVAKLYYYMRDYDTSYLYYRPFVDARIKYELNIYRHINAEIGVVFQEMGFVEESEKYFNDFMDFAENDNSIYKHLNLAMIYSYRGDTEKALEEMRLFALEENYHYWTIIFTEDDPLMDNIKENPEFIKIMNDIKVKFWKNHNKIKAALEEKELLL